MPSEAAKPADNRRIIATGLNFPEGPVACADGSVMFVEIERRTIDRARPDASLEIVAELAGGPNGLAFGPDGGLYVCNNGGFLFQSDAGFKRVRPGTPEGYAGGWIERIDLATGDRQVLYDRCGEHRFGGPNDIVFDRHGGFYFTDYGKSYPRYRLNGGLYYAKADGSSVVQVAYPLFTPNGVGLSPDGNVVYAAETETARLWAFDLEAPGKARRHPFPSPHGGRLIYGAGGYQRFDSLGGRRRRQHLRRDAGDELHHGRQHRRRADPAGADRRPLHHQYLLRRAGHEDRLCDALRHRAGDGHGLAGAGIAAGVRGMSLNRL